MSHRVRVSLSSHSTCPSSYLLRHEVRHPHGGGGIGLIVAELREAEVAIGRIHGAETDQ